MLFLYFFLTFGIIDQGLGVSLLHLRYLGIFSIYCFLRCFKRNPLEDIYYIDQGTWDSNFISLGHIISEI
jgi:hypothetical protein